MIEEYIQTDRRTDRQTDILLTERKSIYNIVNLLKSYDNIHSMTYITKIMLTGIAIRNTGYILKIGSSEPCDLVSTVAMSSVIP